MRWLSLSLLFVALSACAPKPNDPVHEPVSLEAVARGRELVRGLAACGSCHAYSARPDAPLIGGRVFEDDFGAVTVSNITPTWLSQFTTSQVMRMVRGSIHSDDRWLSPEMHRGYEWMSDPDLLAVISYLRSVPAAGEAIEPRTLSFIDRNTKGFFANRHEVTGYVPALRKTNAREYGKYLVDHVARCSFCHTTPAGYFTDSNYMAGGRTVRNDHGEKAAPALLNSSVYGIGDWTEPQIVNYLRTGMTPDSNVVDTNFCPVPFFALGSDEDLQMIARYLKSLK